MHTSVHMLNALHAHPYLLDWYLSQINVHQCRRTCRINVSVKIMVIIIAGDHRLHVQNAYWPHILRMSGCRYSTIVIALWCLSLTYYKTTVVSRPHRHVSKIWQFPIPKNHMFCGFVSLCKTLHLYCLVRVQPRKTS